MGGFKKIAFVSRAKYLSILGILFFIEFTALAFNVYDRKDWILENVLVGVFVLFLVFTYKRFPLSRISYTLIFIFLCFHEIGSHYTYAEVPYNDWFEALFGTSLNSLFGWERNHFDRLVHCSYGLLLAYPVREVFLRIADAKGFWGYFLPVDITMSTSMLYELIEWGTAAFFGGELGQAYQGTCRRAGLVTADRCLRADQGVAEEKVAFSATLTRRNTEMRSNHRQPEGLWLRTPICGFRASR